MFKETVLCLWLLLTSVSHRNNNLCSIDIAYGKMCELEKYLCIVLQHWVVCLLSIEIKAVDAVSYVKVMVFWLLSLAKI